MIFSTGVRSSLILLSFSACAPRYVGPAIDVHAHLVTEEQLPAFHPGVRAGSAALLEAMAHSQVVESALIVIAPEGDEAATRAQNDAVIAAAKASEGRLFAVASVHPSDGEAAWRELERVASLGVRVIKLHPNSQHFDVADEAVGQVVDKAGSLNLFVLFDGYSPFDANETGKFLLLALKHPKARLILAHLGGARFQDFALFAIARKAELPWWPKNVWFDLSATAHFFVGSPYEAQLRWLVRQLGTDRVLFGSDYPVDTPAHAVDDLQRLGFTVEEQRQMLFENARGLLPPR